MDFQLNEFQQDLVAMVQDLGRGRFGPDGFTPPANGLPREYLKVLAGQDLAGISLPEDVGGQGQTLLDAVLAIETLSQYSAAAGDCLQVMNFGAIQQIARHGTADQRRRFLAACLAGDKIPTIAMTEPEAGSAVTELRTRATIEGDDVSVVGQKVFTTNGENADIFVVWVRFGPSARDTGAVLVERGTPGFTVDGTHTWMSGEAYGMLYFDDARVPVDNILVASNGFAEMLPVFNIERLGNASRSLGYGKAALAAAIAHAKERRQFGRRLVEFQGLQWRFAEMKLKLDSAQLLLYRAAANSDVGTPSALEASLAKLACNRAGFEVTNMALQILGGAGYESESPMSYMLARTRGWLIAGGTEEQMLNRIAAELLGERFSQRPPKPVGA